ncbi:hypothetical protein [Leptospira borgpetersenii]|uniref:Uncharacterized protein n=1 Tax=Leptospira borgpetersenii serovar Ballum TaxID=280505 RepID=A0A0S2INB0_LEPBO|nr:hypothetical protein [Leptospira borgpetersenii]ALO25163.1 hypothetical protein LBBP_00841 [Leptospira borgpetersenii serovar Ballum]QVK68718.1 hypothetical protein FH590_09665 [Leptospira borgpetersenii]UZW31908.1 hypothetical protein OR565_09800 [Leptospira borgpetersenii]
MKARKIILTYFTFRAELNEEIHTINIGLRNKYRRGVKGPKDTMKSYLQALEY